MGFKAGMMKRMSVAAAIAGGVCFGGGAQASLITYTLTPSDKSSFELASPDPHGRVSITTNWQPFDVTVDPDDGYRVTGIDGFNPVQISFDNAERSANDSGSGWSSRSGSESFSSEFTLKLDLAEAPYGAWEGTHEVRGELSYNVAWSWDRKFLFIFPLPWELSSHQSSARIDWTDALLLGSIEDEAYIEVSFSDHYLRPGGSNALATPVSVTGHANPPSEVPEPTVLMLFGAGLLGLGFLRRRRNTV
ncbi:PEP-CTERM sorting domain-containing protein [Ectothiorhodospira sp. BSL-9]|uniref:PEP-CTERM sorting domain-containing protein n=1 Tax=Ectothiorhodospira sp. BSL-9 TaxID=1442136 RepID=UPI0007B43CCF|nr:PEP-CTERM sorting domain-containing protein [Ectothiorhodospira sp. BSL-9]ANB02227.1 hypothetical protein ECTOBSL9_1570 [Ectothiorhodospira sp. BSL-9]